MIVSSMSTYIKDTGPSFQYFPIAVVNTSAFPGHGKFNHLVLFTSGLIMLNVSMESVGMSYAITSAECELRLTSTHKGLVNAAAFIGTVYF